MKKRPKVRKWAKEFSNERTRHDRPYIDWVCADHHDVIHAFFDRLEDKSNNKDFAWMLGMWPDVKLARQFGLTVHDVVKARRIIGAPAMTTATERYVEKIVGPMVRLLAREGEMDKAYNLRRWAVGLRPIQAKRCRWRSVGTAWWQISDNDPMDYRESKRLQGKSCGTCRYWRGLDSLMDKENKLHTGAWCVSRDSVRNTIGRDWLVKHGGTVGRMAHPWFTNCPAWKPLDFKLRRRTHKPRFKGDNSVRWVSTVTHAHYSPQPLPPMDFGLQIVKMPEWLALMDEMRRNES
tara:strand:+ start:3633 stop:4508 length:876 start_codon:yes stop_codon:yes gene_type:complete